MFKGSYQKKLLTILYSGGSNPLEIWDIQVKNGWTRRVKDEDMGNIVFEICGTNVATAYIVSPPDPKGLGIALPFITMFLKNLKRYFTFEIQILDDKHMRRRFRFSNYQSSTKVRPFMCSVPLALKPGWNQMQLNLANFTMRAYGTNYMETQRVQIHANCRIRRVYFSDRLYTDEELPRDYRVRLDLRQSQQQQAPTQDPSKVPPSSEVHVPSPILKSSSTTLKQPAFIGREPDRKSSETLVKDTSFKSTESSAGKEQILSELVARTSSVETVKFNIEENDVPKVSPTASVQSAKSVELKKTSSIRVVTFKEEDGAQPEEGEIREEGEEPLDGEGEPAHPSEALPDVEELINEPEPEEFSIEDESPRTDIEESEYAESEPIPESDVEEIPEPPEEITHEYGSA